MLLVFQPRRPSFSTPHTTPAPSYLLFLIKNRVKISEKVKEGFEDENPVIFVPFIIGTFVLLFLTLVYLFSLPEDISKVLNPQYFAIKEVIK